MLDHWRLSLLVCLCEMRSCCRFWTSGFAKCQVSSRLQGLAATSPLFFTVRAQARQVDRPLYDSNFGGQLFGLHGGNVSAAIAGREAGRKKAALSRCNHPPERPASCYIGQLCGLASVLFPFSLSFLVSVHSPFLPSLLISVLVPIVSFPISLRGTVVELRTLTFWVFAETTIRSPKVKLSRGVQKSAKKNAVVAGATQGGEINTCLLPESIQCPIDIEISV